jgi:hypothetical protein
MPILPACRLVLYRRTVVWVAALVWNPFRTGPACLPDALTGMVTRGRRVGASQASLPVALASRIDRGLLFAADGFGRPDWLRLPRPAESGAAGPN